MIMRVKIFKVATLPDWLPQHGRPPFPDYEIKYPGSPIIRDLISTVLVRGDGIPADAQLVRFCEPMHPFLYSDAAWLLCVVSETYPHYEPGDPDSMQEIPADFRLILEDDLILNGDPEAKTRPVGVIHNG